MWPEIVGVPSVRIIPGKLPEQGPRPLKRGWFSWYLAFMLFSVWLAGLVVGLIVGSFW